MLEVEKFTSPLLLNVSETLVKPASSLEAETGAGSGVDADPEVALKPSTS
jgi:hypothetical protein